MRRADTSDTGSTGVLTVQAAEEQNEERTEVLFTRVSAEEHPIYLSLKGRTIPNRSVTVRSATTGTVIAAPTREGAIVGRGTPLCRLDVDARQARFAEAEAMVTSRRVDYDAAQELADKGWASPNRATSAKASLDAAQAELNSARIELSRTEIRAPFAGVFETRSAEIGDFLSPGSPCGTITDLDPIKIETDVTEIHATKLALGAAVAVEIVGLPDQQGEISFIARTAEDNTRTFRVEAVIPNRDGKISAGLTSNLRIKVGDALATPVSPALLTLHDDGRLGIRYLDASDAVQFIEANIVDNTGSAVWLAGLPEDARLLTAGQDFVKEGTIVVPIDVSRADQL